jgi:hypothetical protein
MTPVMGGPETNISGIPIRVQGVEVESLTAKRMEANSVAGTYYLKLSDSQRLAW